jgi:hypothetical protein
LIFVLDDKFLQIIVHSLMVISIEVLSIRVTFLNLNLQKINSSVDH